MEFLSADFWNERYVQGETGWDLGRVSPPIQAFIDGLTDQRLNILIPGAGNAYEAAYLMEKGFSKIVIVDFAEQALTNFAKSHPDFPKEQLVRGDFFELTGTFDLIIEQTFFCAIDPTLRLAYVKQVSSLLKPGGMLAGVLFDRRFDSGPPFGGSKTEYMELFRPWFSDVQMEPCMNSVAPRAGTEIFIRCTK